MIFLEKNNLNNRYYVPFDKYDGIKMTVEEANKVGIFVDTIPQALNNGKGCNIKLIGTPKKILNENDIETAKYNSTLLDYDYYDLPLTEEELTQQKIMELEMAIAELSMMVVQSSIN